MPMLLEGMCVTILGSGLSKFTYFHVITSSLLKVKGY